MSRNPGGKDRGMSHVLTPRARPYRRESAGHSEALQAGHDYPVARVREMSH